MDDETKETEQSPAVITVCPSCSRVHTTETKILALIPAVVVKQPQPLPSGGFPILPGPMLHICQQCGTVFVPRPILDQLLGQMNSQIVVPKIHIQ